MAQTIYIPVEEQNQEGEARRLVATWAQDHGYGAEDRSTLTNVVSELARNLALHTTQGGFLLLRRLEGRGVEVLSLDRGPGMSNFAACLRDGYSSAGTAGMGLGAITRAADLFDVHSQLERGTALLCQLFTKGASVSANYRVGLVNVAKKGETVSGDAFAHLSLPGGRARMMVADGLGHGVMAAEAAKVAVEIFEQGGETDLVMLLERMNREMRSTRGAAIAVAEVSFGQEKVRYAGVGNISGAIMSHQKASHLVSNNGTVGANFPKPKEFTYPWTSDSMLVMNSDGLKSQWRLDTYAGLQEKHPSLAAGILFRDFNRGNDDSTVATLRHHHEHRA